MTDAATATTPTSSNGTPPAKKTKPSKVLPSDRMAVPKQLDVLRTYAAIASAGKGATPAEVGKILDLHPDTVATAHGGSALAPSTRDLESRRREPDVPARGASEDRRRHGVATATATRAGGRAA